MSSANRENTITGRVANYLREHDITAETFKSQQMPGKTHPVEPDFTIENGGVFFGEAKWESDYFEGIAEARDYGLIPSKGTFAIGYPEELKQRRLSEYTNDEESLSGRHYRVAFMRPDTETDMTSLPIKELPEWLHGHLHENVKPKTDPDEAVALLRQIATAFTREFDNVETPDLFRNVLGVAPSESQQAKAAKRAAGYLLIDQIAFYRVLSSTGRYQEIEPDSLTSPSDLQAYFEDVLEDNYAAIFSFPVAEAYPQEALPLLRRGIKSIYGLAPNQINHEVLGTVFHSLTPASVRKPLGAYYTTNKAAEVLADLSVSDSSNTVFDPSCGSGTLLTAAYRSKRERHPNFTEAEHRMFVEDDITGIDIMPFAAHLSTIHLALERPIYQTDEVRIGIDDATKLNPGTSIPPLSYTLPEALIGQKSIEDYSGDMEWREETVEQGSVTADGVGKSNINLKKDDVVIMNPPFSRQESVTQFSGEYKQKLRDRFAEYDEYIHGKMSYCSYFLLLADRFLNEGGRLAAVLPASFLTKSSDRKIRNLLLENYDIEYLLAREDKPNFSEDTDFRELLLVATKGRREETPTTVYVSLDGLQARAEEIEAAAQEVSEGEVVAQPPSEQSDNNYTVGRFPTEELEDNLFAPFAVKSHELFKLWYRIRSNDNFVNLRDLDTGLIRGIGSRDWQEGLLNNPTAKLRKKDIWTVGQVNEDSVRVRHRFVNETVKIPKDSVVNDFHRFAGRSELDATDLDEFALVEDPGTERFFELSETEGIPKWWRGNVSNNLPKRLGHIAFVRRPDLTAPGTRHLAYYTGERRLFHGMWVMPKLGPKEAKQFAVWFNSSLNGCVESLDGGRMSR